MRANSPLKVQFRLTEEAIELAKKLNISLGLESNEPFSSVFYLRSISFENISIKSKDIKVINTGIHIIVTDPFYEVCVSAYMNILKNKGLGVFPCSYYKYGNELLIIVYNYSEESQTIIPAEKIALLSFKEIVLVETENIDSINNDGCFILSNIMKNTDHLYNSKDHSWVQKDKLISKVKNILNKYASVKEDSYLCLDKDFRNTSNFYFKKGTVLIIKQTDNDGWSRVVDINNKGGWWIQTNKLEQIKDNLITYGESIESIVEKRLK
jgi:dUTPase